MPTYTAPGVYVEEVVSTQKVLSAAPTAVAAFVGFTERAPDRRPERPAGPRARAWSPAGTSSRACTAASRQGCRAARCRSTATSPTAAASPTSCRVPNTEPVRRARSRRELPAADRALGLPDRGREPRARRRHQRSGRDRRRRRRRRRARPVHASTSLDGGEVVETYADLDARQGRRATSPRSSTRPPPRSRSRSSSTTRRRPVEPARAAQARRLRPGEGRRPRRFRSTAASSPARSRPAHGINGLAVAEDVTMVIVPDLVTAATKEDGTARPRPVEGRADAR